MSLQRSLWRQLKRFNGDLDTVFLFWVTLYQFIIISNSLINMHILLKLYKFNFKLFINFKLLNYFSEKNESRKLPGIPAGI